MEKDQEIIELFDKLQIFEDLYETIRFVDPVNKKVLSYKNGDLTEVKSNCYDNWKKNKLCLNCTSMRAYNKQRTFMKIEHNLTDIYMVTSIPIKLSDRHIVIKLLRDASMSMGFDIPDGSEGSDMYQIIDNMNSVLLKDSLTNIYNRRYINELLPVDVAISSTINQNFSIIIADIDLFKTINDTYSHLVGDVVLKKFARILTECMPDDNSWIARYGGEEFIIGLHEYTKEELIDLAENMRQTIEESIFSNEDVEITLTASFGIASIEDIEKPNVSKLIDCADKNLYKAKNDGRNKVVY